VHERMVEVESLDFNRRECFPDASGARSSTGQSIGLRSRGLGVRIPPGAPMKSRVFLVKHDLSSILTATEVKMWLSEANDLTPLLEKSVDPQNPRF
jgi:hypothetical protein